MCKSHLVVWLFALSFVPATSADAQTRNVRVFIEKVVGQDCVEEVFTGCQSDPDFYAVVKIGDEEFNTKTREGGTEFPNRRDIDTPNWELFKPVDAGAGTIAITIGLWDQDGFLDGAPPDDHVDLDGDGNSRSLDLTINLAACSAPGGAGGVTGDVNGNCNGTLASSGTGNDRADIRFRIVVEAPPSEGDTRVSCMHSPLWPQSGDALTVKGTALDGTLSPAAIGSIELWVDDRNSARQTCTVTPGSAPCSVTVPATGANYAYGCRVVNGTQVAWSGWKSVQVGNPSSGKAIPILQTGPRDRRIDIVFIADDDGYTSGTDPAFLADVSKVIEEGYFAEDLFLSNQHNISFWVAPDMGDAGGYKKDPPRCELTGPGNWNDVYSFADAGAVLHPDNFRDCAKGDQRLFSSEPSSLRTILHETGHTPFGLADEYCCDGGYFEVEPWPNLHYEKDDCRADAADLGVDPDRCRGFRGKHSPFDWLVEEDWFTSDLEDDHLMDDNQRPEPADRRRITEMFERCRQAKCQP